MLGSRFHAGSALAKVCRALALPTAVVTAIGLIPGQAYAGGAPPRVTAPQSRQIAQARAESRAFTAKSSLTTAQLIQAARRAGKRLAIHTRPSPPRDIRVHAPILHRAASRSILRAPIRRRKPPRWRRPM